LVSTTGSTSSEFAPESDAARDQLRPHDIIVKVDGDVIRSLDHLRAVIAEAYLG